MICIICVIYRFKGLGCYNICIMNLIDDEQE